VNSQLPETGENFSLGGWMKGLMVGALSVEEGIRKGGWGAKKYSVSENQMTLVK